MSYFFILLYSVGRYRPRIWAASSLVPIGPLQRLYDRHLLDLNQRHVGWNRELRRRLKPPSDRFREISWNKLIGLADQDRALHGILQLADIAGPAMTNQQVRRSWRDAPDIAAVPFVEHSPKVIGERRDILGALPERRHLQCDRIDSKVQVFAEPAFAN